MKKSDFEALPIPYALTFIAEQAGVKWDAEGPEELPRTAVFAYGSGDFCVFPAAGKWTHEQAKEAVRLLSVIPEIRKATETAGLLCGPGNLIDRLLRIKHLLSGLPS